MTRECFVKPEQHAHPAPDSRLQQPLTAYLLRTLRARSQVSIELDIADCVSEEAVALFRPDLIVAHCRDVYPGTSEVSPTHTVNCHLMAKTGAFACLDSDDS